MLPKNNLPTTFLCENINIYNRKSINLGLMQYLGSGCTEGGGRGRGRKYCKFMIYMGRVL